MVNIVVKLAKLILIKIDFKSLSLVFMIIKTFCHLKLKIASAIPASNKAKEIHVCFRFVVILTSG